MDPQFQLDYRTQFDWFTSKGIDVSIPGFYDNPIFLKLEKQIPSLLNNYASFVLQKPYKEEYLRQTRLKITRLVSSFYQELERDGRLGACIDASNTLSRVFDQEGIWNFILKGSLTLTFPISSEIRKKYFWSIDFGNYVAAHAWIVAPPFKIIDVTVMQQPYKSSEKLYLPSFVLQEEVISAQYDILDLVEPNILAAYQARFGQQVSSIINHLMPDLPIFSSFFRPTQFSSQGMLFKYIPTGVIASDRPLTEDNALRLNGMSAWELYQKVLKPVLKNI